MTTKEKVIHESLDRVNTRLSEIDEILNANPLSDIINGRKEAQDLIKAYDFEHPNADPFTKKLRKLADREKELFAIAEKQKNTSELISEKVKLTMEQSLLKSELFFLDKSNFR